MIVIFEKMSLAPRTGTLRKPTTGDEQNGDLQPD
jgi:hypothetical protein